MANIYSHVLLEGAGSKWDDFLEYWKMCTREKAFVFPTGIHIWSGQFLDKLQVVYDPGSMPSHGGHEPGRKMDIGLEKNEYINKVGLSYTHFGRSDYMINVLTFYTTKGKKHEFHSWCALAENSKWVEYTLPEGFGLAALGGRVDHFGKPNSHCIAGLTLYYKEIEPKETELFEKKTCQEAGFEQQLVLLNQGTAMRQAESEKWVNTILEIKVPENTRLLCASASCGEEEVAMPSGVQIRLYNSFEGEETACTGEVKSITHHNGSFYQMNCGNPRAGSYFAHIKARTDARLYFEVQQVSHALKEDMLKELVEELEGFEPEEKGMPVFLRPEYRMGIVREAPEEADPPAGGIQPLAIPWWYHLLSAIKLHPYIAVGISAAALAVILWKLIHAARNGKTKEELVNIQAEEIAKRADWGTDAGAEYRKYDPEEYKKGKISDKFKVSKNALRLYEHIQQKNNYNLSADSMQRITRSDVNNYGGILKVDVGGEGCFSFSGMNAGASDALNFNTKMYNSQYKSALIPMLVHFSDWNKNSFPIEDGIVDAFLMQGCGNPTRNEADEMIRCIKKNGGRIDFWFTHLNLQGKNLCAEYIACKLHTIVHYDEKKLVEEAYPEEYSEFCHSCTIIAGEESEL